MSLKIFNTLTRKMEEFKPVQSNRVHIYVCGPTVYSHAHIGHAKSYISFDVVVRYFKYLGYRVKYIQNITDVGHLTDDADEGEDKILKKAREEKIDPMEIAESYAWSYFDDMQALGVLRADIYPRATGHICEQIEMVQQLIEKGYAYEVNGNVYFDVSKFNEYGKLSGRKVDELITGVRIEVNPEKRNSVDFALWKRAEPEHLMRWKSPWGEGYPGWHLECSAMSMKYLGNTIDIHGGGLDNIFPHHECEIAQSESLTGKPFVRYWMHNNMVTVNGNKMSKSVGNFITIKDALKTYSSSTLRYFILSSHYRSSLDVSDKALNSARKGIERLHSTIDTLKESINKAKEIQNFDSPFDPGAYRVQFEEMMNDDFNTPRAIAVLFDLSREVNSYLNSNTAKDRFFLEQIDLLYQILGGEVLGILDSEKMGDKYTVDRNSVDKVVQILIKTRDQLRKEKLFKLADNIRDELRNEGITLVDRPEGTSYEFD